MHDKQKTTMNRRSFLGVVGGMSTAVAATAAATFDSTEAQAYDPGEEGMKTRYRETDHVKTFYRVNGYRTQDKSGCDADQAEGRPGPSHMNSETDGGEAASTCQTSRPTGREQG